MSLERGGNLPAFQVEVFGWGRGCILVKKGVLNTRSLEILEVVEADDAGSLILCDVVEWAGSHRAPVELHFCQTVDVASILSDSIGREWVVCAVLPVFVYSIFLLPTFAWLMIRPSAGTMVTLGIPMVLLGLSVRCTWSISP